MVSDTDSPHVSVVIPTKDRPVRLRALLNSLAEQTTPNEHVEIIVVDDGSEGEETGRILAAAAVRTLRHARPGGPATARNSGWRSARAPLVAFIDDDCRADPAWLESLLIAAEKAPGSVLQGRTLPDPTELHCRGPYSRTVSVERLGPHFQTCNIAYPRALLNRLGGFDESFPCPGGEDTDLAWRALETGCGAHWMPDALVVHAVEYLGPIGKLRLALRWSETIRAYARHPAYRRLATRRGCWKASHAALVYAVMGLMLSFRREPAVLLAVPYVLHVAHEVRQPGCRALHAPFIVLHDVTEMVATTRGSVRFRVAAF